MKSKNVYKKDTTEKKNTTSFMQEQSTKDRLQSKYFFEFAVIKRTLEHHHGYIDLDRNIQVLGEDEEEEDKVLSLATACPCPEGKHFMYGYAESNCKTCSSHESKYLKRLRQVFGDQNDPFKPRQMHPCLKLIGEFSPVVHFERKLEVYLKMYNGIQTLTPLVIMKLTKMPKEGLGLLMTMISRGEYNMMKGSEMYPLFNANEMRCTILKTIITNEGRLVKSISPTTWQVDVSGLIDFDLTGERFPTEWIRRSNQYTFLRPDRIQRFYEHVLKVDENLRNETNRLRREKAAKRKRRN